MRQFLFAGAALSLALAAAVPLNAQDSANPVAPSAQGDVSVTIYNNNLALVQDVRQGKVLQAVAMPMCI